MNELVIEPFGNRTVICEGLQLSRAVTSLARGQQSIGVDRLPCASLSIANDSSDRSFDLLVAHPLDILDEPENLRERDLTSTFRCRHGRNLALVHPAEKRRMADPEHAGGVRGSYSSADEILEKLANGTDLLPYAGVNHLLRAAEPQDAFDEGVRRGTHGRTIA